MEAHNLNNPTIIGHSMGAKTAMCVALTAPSKVANLIAVDNAPVDAALKSDFGTYVRGMREVERANVKKLSEADEILQPFAKVIKPHFAPSVRLRSFPSYHPISRPIPPFRCPMTHALNLTL